jgi:hypothetical protein
MKNVNAEMTKYHKEVLNLYEKIKKENKSASWTIDENTSHSNSSMSHNYDFFTNETEYTQEDSGGEGDETETDYDANQNDFDDYEEKTLSDSIQTKNRTRRKRDADMLSNEPPGKEIMGRFVYKKLKGEEIFNMIPQDMTINSNSKQFVNHAFNKVKICNYSLGLDTNLEFYFSSSPPRSTLENFTSSVSKHPFADTDRMNEKGDEDNSALTLQLSQTEDYFSEANEDVNLGIGFFKYYIFSLAPDYI